MKKIAFIALLLVGAVSVARAQSHQVLFNGSSGAPLLDSLVTFYRPGVVLDYANARDTLYAKVMAIDNDTVRCIYSDHALYLSPTADPTQYIYLNGSDLGMNTEHGYPQAKGAADGNARSDMHHLFATRIPVNGERGNLPFGEIVDSQTDKWFYKAEVITSVPTTNKDFYSEKSNTRFEPREAAKGDLARAVFYFYTMYKTQADIADPQFFELQRPTMCQWNKQDPVTAEEMIKTWRIAPYQEGKPNPFIVDCTLAQRTYCPDVTPSCLLTAGEPQSARLPVQIAPQPFQGSTVLSLELPFAGDLTGIIRAVDGRELARFEQKDLAPGRYTHTLQLALASGRVAFLEVHLTGKTGQRLSNALPLVGQ